MRNYMPGFVEGFTPMMNDEDDAPPELVNVAASAEPEQEENASRVPITLVTGYLGAGKTTLLNYILTEKHGKRIAVIMNEFGDSTDIEKSMTINQNGQEVTEWLELGNGCICCSVKDAGVQAIESLMDRRGTFDYILLETTGLADPGNIAPMFWVDDQLGSSIYLDGIVTLVDAKNILRLLDEPAPEETVHAAEPDSEHKQPPGPAVSMAHLQISHADVVILNKADLVTPEELDQVRQRITSINGAARIHVTSHGRTPQIERVVLDLHAYDHLSSSLGSEFADKGHAHIDPRISTITVTYPERLHPDQVSQVDAWLRAVLWDGAIPSLPDSEPRPRDYEIHRLKGILALSDGSFKVIQAVREVFEIRDSPNRERQQEAPQPCKIVLIGRDVGKDTTPWERSFRSFLKEVG